MNLDTQSCNISAEVIKESGRSFQSLIVAGKKLYMFIGFCTAEGCLKHQRVLVSATPMFLDKVISRNSGFFFQTVVKQYEPVILSPFLQGFNSARMPVMLPSPKL